MEKLQARKATHVIAISLSFLAGYVDALGFLKLGGVFISFMSGNSTRLGVSGIVDDTFPALMLAGIIGLFVLGVIVASLIGHFVRTKRSVAIIAFVTVLLALAGIFDGAGYLAMSVATATMAMGAINTLFEKDGEVSVALTYMTGTLVRMGQQMAKAITGGPRLGWVRYLLLWSGLVCGALTGAFFYSQYGFAAIWLSAVQAGVILLVIFKMDRQAR